MTARDWPRGPGQDSLAQRRKEESGVLPEQERTLEKESLVLEFEPEQELEGKQQVQELEGKQQVQTKEQVQEQKKE